MGGAQLARDEAAGLLPEEEGEESDHFLVGDHRIGIGVDELEETRESLVERDLHELHECVVQRFGSQVFNRFDGEQLHHSIRGRTLGVNSLEGAYEEGAADA